MQTELELAEANAKLEAVRDVLDLLQSIELKVLEQCHELQAAGDIEQLLRTGNLYSGLFIASVALENALGVGD